MNLNVFLHKTVSFISTAFLAIGSFFTPHPPQSPIVGSTFQTPDVLALKSTSLVSSISSSATSMSLVDGTYNNTATTIASSTYGAIIDEGTATEEIVLADCTGATCTNMTRGLDRATGTTTVAALQFAHRRGASVKITNAPALLFVLNVLKGRQNIENSLVYNSALSFSTSSNQIPGAQWVASFANVASTSALKQITQGTNTFTALQTFNTLPQSSVAPSSGSDLVNKTYTDNGLNAGAANADYTTKGISERATVAEINSGTATGSTAPAPLFMNPSDFANSTYASSTSYSTTSVQALASSTMSQVPGTQSFRLIMTGTTTASTGTLNMTFNGDNSGSYSVGYTEDGTFSNFNNQSSIRLTNNSVKSYFLTANIYNPTGTTWYRRGTYSLTGYDSSQNITHQMNGSFTWKSFNPIASVTFSNLTAGDSLQSGTVIKTIGE